MFALKIAAVAAIAALSNAVPASFKNVLHEKRQAPSSDWVKVARIEGTAILPMRIGLTQSNLEKGHDLLMEVYVPNFLSH
jgi:tripeptidyl-peptidase I